ncbi:hypothetical protein D3C80_1979500 [compost metagenome]
MGQQAVYIDFVEGRHIKRLQYGANRNVEPENAIFHKLRDCHGGDSLGNGGNAMDR